MQLTKFTHACVRLDDGDRSLVIDPGVFSEVDEAMAGVSAVLITHEHPDHIDAERVRAALDRDSGVALFAPQSVTDQLADLGDRVVTVAPGERFEAGGFGVQAFGGQHALIHPLIHTIPNIAYLVDGAVYHPGDSFTVPTAPVSTLLLPTHAPWSKTSEVIDFAIAVRARRVHQIHDSLITDVAAGMIEGHIGRLGEPHGVEFTHLQPHESVTL
jgi:L-ascorbate metabolism protein UlaG (beta-lactamase superfamily)